MDFVKVLLDFQCTLAKHCCPQPTKKETIVLFRRFVQQAYCEPRLAFAQLHGKDVIAQVHADRTKQPCERARQCTKRMWLPRKATCIYTGTSSAYLHKPR